ncbi:hypothetical protein [Haematobacter genomosp. 1]|uniref:Uncharacterized protein n=1 Tax=Haematobacter genomosp. 1 TaxID=366618 RepID=A0A212A6V5_9RHOB|nr:hypothetical protein [Haematobacter genomosp. 1]OWJ75033.1 hypothetical protein CDV49_18090 [Haematobacter genomosp. 1]
MIEGPFKTYRHFENTDDAIAFRKEHGTGGWIFSITDTGEAILFPWQMTPSQVLDSPYVRPFNGRLIGHVPATAGDADTA